MNTYLKNCIAYIRKCENTMKNINIHYKSPKRFFRRQEKSIKLITPAMVQSKRFFRKITPEMVLSKRFFRKTKNKI